MQRAPGIRLLQYTLRSPDMQRKQEIIKDLIPKVAAQLPPEAAIELDLSSGELLSTWPAIFSLATAQPASECPKMAPKLCQMLASPKRWTMFSVLFLIHQDPLALHADLVSVLCAADAEALFRRQEPAPPMPHRDGPLAPYWASLAGTLTRLDLQFSQSVVGATILPLSQLSRLQSLSLRCHGWSADVKLSLPQLQELEIFAVQHACITLMCPQLRKLHVMSAAPLEAFDGIPLEIEDLSFSCLKDDSVSLYNMLGGRRLKQPKVLRVSMPPESYESPVASEGMKQVLRESKLTSLITDCPVEQLTPMQGSRCALPMSLQYLVLDLPLDRGIPLVLEQLTNLRVLAMTDTKQGPMHLDRSLDPFLDMKHLGSLAFMGKPAKSEHALQTRFEWTSEALEVLLLARIRLQNEAQMPGSRRPPTLWC